MSDRRIAIFPPSFSPAVATISTAARPVTALTKLSFACLCGLLTGSVGLVGVTQAFGQQICRPGLAFKEVGMSAMKPPSLEREWTAVLAVDASHCATTSGRFAIVFSRLKENGSEIEFQEQFIWKPASVTVSVDFWADEAVERYWVSDIAACPCRD